MIAMNVPFTWLFKRLPRERYPDAFRGWSPVLASKSNDIPLRLTAVVKAVLTLS
jgi:hypothetical protein